MTGTDIIRRLGTGAAALGLVAGLAACGSSSSTSASSSTSTSSTSSTSAASSAGGGGSASASTAYCDAVAHFPDDAPDTDGKTDAEVKALFEAFAKDQASVLSTLRDDAPQVAKLDATTLLDIVEQARTTGAYRRVLARICG